MAAVRHMDGFRRYAVSIQYNGRHFLGFQRQINQEDCILPNGTDHRGLRTVENYTRDAFSALVGEDNFENLQVSSRTDRGVHALKNTFHIDIRPRNHHSGLWDIQTLCRGLNHYLSCSNSHHNFNRKPGRKMQDIKILSACLAPKSMVSRYYNSSKEENGPLEVDWNARYSATSRTYVYRILCSNAPISTPFEWEYAWVLQRNKKLDVTAMHDAAQYLVGCHDMTSFRNPRCSRRSPIITLYHASVTSQPYGILDRLGIKEDMQHSSDYKKYDNGQLILVKVTGNSFLYRQVRKMVGCLVNVGLGKLSPLDVNEILQARDSSKVWSMAPASGLFLVNVEHGDFKI
jgi:tRNA pseudouridine38-40 synthase